MNKINFKKGLFTIVIIFSFFLININLTAKGKGDTVKSIITIDNSKVFGVLSKPSVNFTHFKHSNEYKVKCDNCHHKVKSNLGKDGGKVKNCSSCHSSPKENIGEILSLMNAYHKNCRSCHKDQNKGPQKCDGCHIVK